ncbi:IPExxxVDY family protein [Flagellimonas meishanensis]|uniref:IPExxxVDY family protein n=1 Tax=Flagellimonas meishanensis TaxID=2873264 RepID=UPI001CA79FF6|nr:IPExxxVDY family protein [[Muricauda] meishanensis]
MLTTHRISADLYDDEFGLIAIHSSLADHAIAYAINGDCGLRLKRMANDFLVGAQVSFSIFDWDDELNGNYWTLVSNICEVEEEIPSEGFFASGTSLKKSYLVEERKEVDYFLKVEVADESLIDPLIRKINNIPNVVTAYSVEIQSLKSKRNLIF